MISPGGRASYTRKAPTNQPMKANTITPRKVDDLIAALEAALENAKRVKAEIEVGDIAPITAAAILNESARYVAKHYRD